MIGNEADALFIRDWYHREEVATPQGWLHLGSGCYRAAYLHIASRVVYKVQLDYTYSHQTNEGEAEILRRAMFTRLPAGCRLPRFRYFHLEGEGVMAMERFTRLLYDIPDPENRKYLRLINPLRRSLEVGDLHDENLAIDEENGLLVPIDVAG